MCTLESVKEFNMCEKGKFIHELRDTHFHLINDVIKAVLVIVHSPTWVPTLVALSECAAFLLLR